MKVGVLSLALFALALADKREPVFKPGKCPRPKVVENFRMLDYLGTWYSIEVYPTHYAKSYDSGCSSPIYTLRDDGRIRVNNTAYNLDAQRWQISPGEAYLEDPTVGALNVRIDPQTKFGDKNYRILDTDYLQYAIVHTCAELGPNYAETISILSRTPLMCKEYLDTLHYYISHLGYDLAPLRHIIQDERCGRAPSLLNDVGSQGPLVVKPGQCPKPKTMPNFRVNDYLGAWYEIEKYPAAYELEYNSRLDCVVANYSSLDDGRVGVKVNNSAYSLETFKWSIALGEGVPEGNDPSKLTIKFFDFNQLPPGNYWVLDTDYQQYSITYTCQQKGASYVTTIGILSRTPTMNPDLLQAIKGYLTYLGFDPAFLRPTVQDARCPKSWL